MRLDVNFSFFKDLPIYACKSGFNTSQVSRIDGTALHIQSDVANALNGCKLRNKNLFTSGKEINIYAKRYLRLLFDEEGENLEFFYNISFSMFYFFRPALAQTKFLLVISTNAFPVVGLGTCALFFILFVMTSKTNNVVMTSHLGWTALLDD